MTVFQFIVFIYVEIYDFCTIFWRRTPCNWLKIPVTPLQIFIPTDQRKITALFQQEVKVFDKKRLTGGAIPRLGVTPGGQICTIEFLG